MSKDFHNNKNKWTGFYRARVTGVDLEEDGVRNFYGAIKIFVPDIMNSDTDDEIDEYGSGIIAYPAGSLPMGGYTEDSEGQNGYYSGSMIVPSLHTYVWVFFEGGLIDRAFYFSSLNLKQHPILSENLYVDEPHKVYTILKSGQGRAIVISDSEDQQRVEITGKKRQLRDGPSGDKNSVYNLDQNQTVILLDETEGHERLLIYTHQGDYINLDITKRKLNVFLKSDISIETEGKLSIKAKESIDIKSNKDVVIEGSSGANLKSGENINITASGTNNFRSGDETFIDASYVKIQGGGASSSRPSSPTAPSSGKKRRPPTRSN